MTNDETAITLIASSFIAQLIASLVAVFVGKPRNNQPKPTPEASQPKNSAQRIKGWFMRFVESPLGFPPLFVVVYTVQLVWVMRDARPVTRGVILAISGLVAGIFWNLGYILIWRVIKSRDKSDSLVLEIINGSIELNRDLHEWVKALSDTVLAMEKSNQPTRGPMDRLRAAMKELFRD